MVDSMCSSPGNLSRDRQAPAVAPVSGPSRGDPRRGRAAIPAPVYQGAGPPQGRTWLLTADLSQRSATSRTCSPALLPTGRDTVLTVVENGQLATLIMPLPGGPGQRRRSRLVPGEWSGGRGGGWVVLRGFVEAAEGDFEAGGAEPADVADDLPAGAGLVLVVVRAEVGTPHAGVRPALVPAAAGCQHLQ
jgi:hypothetical protein